MSAEIESLAGLAVGQIAGDRGAVPELWRTDLETGLGERAGQSDETFVGDDLPVAYTSGEVEGVGGLTDRIEAGDSGEVDQLDRGPGPALCRSRSRSVPPARGRRAGSSAISINARSTVHGRWSDSHLRARLLNGVQMRGRRHAPSGAHPGTAGEGRGPKIAGNGAQRASRSSVATRPARLGELGLEPRSRRAWVRERDA